MRLNLNRLTSLPIFFLLIFAFFPIARAQEPQLPKVEEVAKPIPKGKVFVPFGVGNTRSIPASTSSSIPGPTTSSPQPKPSRNPSRPTPTTGTAKPTETNSILSPSPPSTTLHGRVRPTLETVLAANPHLPERFDGLNAGVDQELQVLTEQEAVKFDIPLIGGSTNDVKLTRKILVKNFIAYNDVTDSNGERVRIGAGLRWIMDIQTTDASTKLSFPVLAAQAQLGIAKGTVRIYTVGMNVDAINNAAKVPTELNVENYFKMAQGFDAAQQLIKGDTKVNPQIVHWYTDVTDPDDTEYTRAILVSWTLARIAERKNIKEAQESCPLSDASAKTTIADIYRLRLNITDILTRPTEIQALQAKPLLGGIKITR